MQLSNIFPRLAGKGEKFPPRKKFGQVIKMEDLVEGIKNPNYAKHTTERFWSHVQVNGPNDCWWWRASVTTAGYGHFRVRGYFAAHRFSYMLRHGFVPSNRFICHSCDNRACVNPNHLWIGDASMNMADAARKNRLFIPRKLTREQVLSMRAEYSTGNYSFGDLAKVYNVGRSTAGAVISRETWKDV